MKTFVSFRFYFQATYLVGARSGFVSKLEWLYTRQSDTVIFEPGRVHRRYHVGNSPQSLLNTLFRSIRHFTAPFMEKCDRRVTEVSDRIGSERDNR